MSAPSVPSPPSFLRAVVVPLAVLLPALAILVGLGVWQLQRKAWKDGLVAQIEARAFGEPVALPPEPVWRDWTAQGGEYTRVRVTGTYLHDAEVAVSGLAPGEGPGRPLLGSYILTPLRLPSGAIVVVNRGFVPPAMAANPPRPPGDSQTVVGLLRAPEQPGWFSPPNDPARNAWYLRDPRAIAAARNLTRVAPFIIDADAAATGPEGWPRAGLTRLELPNRHLEYAVTWFGLAATLVGVGIAFMIARYRRLADAARRTAP